MAAAREVSPGALTSRPIVVDYGCFFRTWTTVQICYPK